jgi:hypothetical protein
MGRQNREKNVLKQNKYKQLHREIGIHHKSQCKTLRYQKSNLQKDSAAFVCSVAPVCCAPFMQPSQRMHIASVMKQCSGYELAVIVMNLLYTLPLTSHHNNKDVYKGATV